MTYWSHIAEHISQSLHKPFHIQSTKSLGGGCINQAFCITSSDGQRYFVKVNQRALNVLFQVEYDSLNELYTAQCAHIPKPICFGSNSSHSYLVLEHLTMKHSGDQIKLAEALARQHKITNSQYGWYQNNVIGSTPQSNRQHTCWLSFWREERLLPQIKLLHDKGLGSSLKPFSEPLLNNLETLLQDHQPSASLLHGDLWSGNYAFDEQGEPIFFDPALYYGDRETDLAMTELFGGFSREFYQHYHNIFPLDDGYAQRKTLYNLYHILNHANLFGHSYIAQATRMMQKLCSMYF
jgi:fructosamine-3-kinase